MQIFLPLPSCLQTAKQLDKRQLNKQIIEAAQIIRSIDGYGTGKRIKNKAALNEQPYFCVLIKNFSVFEYMFQFHNGTIKFRNS